MDEVWSAEPVLDLDEENGHILRVSEDPQDRPFLSTFRSFLADAIDVGETPKWLTEQCPLIRTWRERPRSVQTEKRQDTRILPVVRVVETRPERLRGELFGGLVDGRSEPELPLFEDFAPVRKSVAILDLADISGVPVMAGAQGVPIAARLFVKAALSVSQPDWHYKDLRIAPTVEELLRGLFPTGWRIGRDWLRTKAALTEARDYTIRLPDGGRWFFLALRRLPAEDARGRPSLDDHVVLDLAMPPGATDGPIIDLRELDALSVKSAPAWRANIAARSLNWRPGATRVPISPRKGRKRYGWSHNPDQYPVFTASDRRRLAFGEGDRKHRTKKQIDDAWREGKPAECTIVERAMDPQTGEVGWRILPSHILAPEA